MKIALSLFAFIFLASNVLADDISSYLQSISVTVTTKGGSGSGVIFTRDIKDGDKTKKVNFVWTAAHVLENLRSIRSFIDSEGHVKKTVEFQDAEIRKKIIEGGRTIGQLVLEARVVKYSDAKTGEDLALLMVRKSDFVQDTLRFHVDKDGAGLPLGTQLFHVGSLLGEDGSNSMTTGIMSQVGRTVSLNNGPKILFDQTTVTAFPGSSGGGVFTTDGSYVGMLVRGAGETFNLIVPVRRIRKWAEKEGVLWAMDAGEKAPSVDEIEKITVENMADLKEPAKPFVLPFTLEFPRTDQTTPRINF
jgi:S1-C subfamily serine protease